MANHYFEFKQFKVWQDKCAMKVGTDGVLLGAWADIDSAGRILDVGTGTGLVALMLAQRSPAEVVAVEIDEPAACQAKENIQSSPWYNRIEVVRVDFREYQSEERFDVIVCNPPYFVDSLLPPDTSRTIARHNQGLTYAELLSQVAVLLNPKGHFSLIIPTDVVDSVINIAGKVGLFPFKRVNVVTAPGKIPKRTLLSFRFTQEVCLAETLLIEKRRHCYSDEYIALTKDFYLKM